MTKQTSSHSSHHNSSLWALGLMSGTSLDGIDAALIKTNGITIEERGPGLTVPYEDDFRAHLKSALGKNVRDLQLEAEVTRRHGAVVMDLLKDFAPTVDVIGFHGQTVYHAPPVTLQLGNGEQLAHLTGIPVVYDFRTHDCNQGGQGAPLVPVYHQALCAGMEGPVVVLNLGGVANITYINGDELIGFDTGPGNALIDDFMMTHLDQPYDVGGKIASLGKPKIELLNQWLADPYFQAPYPKSLDRDHFKRLVEGVKGIDGLSTLTAFTAFAVFHALQQIPNFTQTPPKKVIVCGGGRRNDTVLHWLRFLLRKSEVVVCDDLGDGGLSWDGDLLEAQAFAFLAVRSLRGYPLSYPLTTGVCEPMVGGRQAGFVTPH